MTDYGSEYDTVTVKSVGFTLSRLLYQHHGRRVVGLLEKALEANRGLSANMVLPVGTVVQIPVIEDTASPLPQPTQIFS